MIPERQGVIATDVQMPFLSIVVLMVKVAFAAIPAMLVIIFVWVLFYGLLTALVVQHR